jgi:UDP-N-acetylmuramate--alanine ligase
MFAKIQRVHFVGIGGIGMSGIAEVLLNLGFKISGSDLKNSTVTQRLASLGAVIFEGHAAENVASAEVVVTSSAVSPDNPEVAEARKQHVPVIPRAEMLAELMRLKYGIAIAGMHGKTTTTSMVAAVLAAGGLDPTVVVGGRVDAMGSNARLGKSHYLVAEADESDRSFLKLSPILSVVTNIDREHMDCYRNMRDIKQTFLDFMDHVPFYGMIVACNDDPILRKLLPQVQRRVVTYGTRRGSDFLIKFSQSEPINPPKQSLGGAPGLEGAPGLGGTPESEFHNQSEQGLDGPPAPNHRPRSHFRITYRGKDLGEFILRVPGVHNILNATAAIAVGTGLDLSPDSIRAALENFHGVDRRFQLRGQAGGVSVVDDYGHHPTEIKATLAAARQCGFRRIHVIFQPHRYTRTQSLMDEFATAFRDADSLAVLDIYAASERPIEGITAEALAARIKDAQRQEVGSLAAGEKRALNVHYSPSFADAAERAIAGATDGDMILTLGAGSVSQLGPMLLEKLQSRQSAVSA